MVYKGYAHVFGDHISSDYISPGRFKFEDISMKEYATHLMEDIRPGFYNTIRTGDILVAGENFGCGSSRETAVAVILESGISVVLAKSFARTFFRNAVSTGLLIMECDTTDIQEGDLLEVDYYTSRIVTPRGEICPKPFPEALKKAMLSGGMSANFVKNDCCFKL